MPILSLHVSHFNDTDMKQLQSHKTFKNSFDLHFKSNETTKRQPKYYTVLVPAANSNDLELDKTIFVSRIDMENIQELFVTISDVTHNLNVSYLHENNNFLKS